jgi:Sap, sulfolipid-1-addressing protein
VQSLIPSVALLGLAIALSSPTSVLAVYVLLGMPNGVRRAVTFVIGWLVTIALIGILIVVVPAFNFKSSHTTPSRTASVVELLLGAALIGGAFVLYRRPANPDPKDPVPDWLVRLVGRHWAVSLVAGGVMLTYSVTIVAALEILKANVDALDRSIAVAVFGLTSIVTIAAPIIYTVAVPQRATRDLERSRRWLIVHSRTIGVVLLTIIGLGIMLKAAYDLLS